MYFLNINKPKGISSFDCVRILRKKLGIKSIGHSGTLDPLASGVMQIGVGKATKLLDYLESDKTYIADIRFGFNSTTMDDEGDKTFIASPNFKKEDLLNIIHKFCGTIEQTPPKYSAIKQNGKKLCDIVRKNPEVQLEIKPRNVEIFYIKLLEFKGDTAKIEVHCSKGTYIRSLVNDIGQALKCGAYVSDLVRIKAGDFSIENSQELDSDTLKKINPLDAINMPSYELNEEAYKKIMNGCVVEYDLDTNLKEILLTKDNKLVSVAYLSDNPYKKGSKIIKPKKNFKEV